jgi:hypothetical protein
LALGSSLTLSSVLALCSSLTLSSVLALGSSLTLSSVLALGSSLALSSVLALGSSLTLSSVLALGSSLTLSSVLALGSSLTLSSVLALGSSLALSSVLALGSSLTLACILALASCYDFYGCALGALSSLLLLKEEVWGLAARRKSHHQYCAKHGCKLRRLRLNPATTPALLRRWNGSRFPDESLSLLKHQGKKEKMRLLRTNVNQGKMYVNGQSSEGLTLITIL